MPAGRDDATLVATHIDEDFVPDGNLQERVWRRTPVAILDRGSKTGEHQPNVATPVRALWSDRYLYLAYDCPFTQLTLFEPKQEKERFGLWERDVVEAFIGSDTNDNRHYTEFEVSPTNERLDLVLTRASKDFDWSSRFESATHIDDRTKRWTAEMRVPLAALCDVKPARGTRWRINLYRCDYANKAFLALSPTMTGTFHAPERFGVLEFR